MKKLNNVLDPALLGQSRKLEHMTTVLSEKLPPECNGHYQVAALHGKTLVIITDSPVWTTRLRQLGPLIIQNLNSKVHLNLQHVRIVSRHGPAASSYERPTVKHDLSQQSSQHIIQTAAYIEDEALKNALLKIARHGQKK